MWVACGLLPTRRWDAASRIVSKFWEGLGQSRDEPPVKIQSHLVTMTSLFQETSLHFINQPFKCLNRIIAAHRSFYININDNLGAWRRPENYPLDGWDQQMLPLQLNWKSDNIFVIFLPWNSSWLQIYPMILTTLSLYLTQPLPSPWMNISATIKLNNNSLPRSKDFLQIKLKLCVSCCLWVYGV